MLVGTWGQMGKAGGRVLSSHQAAPLCLVLKGAPTGCLQRSPSGSHPDLLNLGVSLGPRSHLARLPSRHMGVGACPGAAAASAQRRLFWSQTQPPRGCPRAPD